MWLVLVAFFRGVVCVLSASNRREALHPLCGAAPVVGRCTCCGALHPNRGGVVLTDRVYCCLCCGCCGGVLRSVVGWCACQARVADVWRCTRYVALHPLWGAAPEQKGCSAYGSGAAPLITSVIEAVCRQTTNDEGRTSLDARRLLSGGARSIVLAGSAVCGAYCGDMTCRFLARTAGMIGCQ